MMLQMQQLLQKARHNTFILHFSGTLLAKYLVLIIGVTTNIILTRYLGVEKKGTYATYTMLVFTIGQLFDLGVSSANVYFVAKNPDQRTMIFKNTVGLYLFYLALAAGFLVVVRWQNFFSQIPYSLIAATTLLVPIYLFQLQYNSILLGEKKILHYNLTELLQRIALFIITAAFIWLQLDDISLFLIAIVVSYLISQVIVVGRLDRRAILPAQINVDHLKRTARYGVGAYIACLMSFLVLRSDVFLIQWLRSDYETGLYATAVNIVDLSILIPVILGNLLFSQLSSEHDTQKKWQQSKKAAWYIGLGMTGFALFIAATSPYLLLLLFGKDFIQSSPSLIILSFAAVFTAVGSVFQNLQASCNASSLMAIGPTIAFVVNLGLNIIFINKWGHTGAALSSLVSYGLMMVVSIYLGRKACLIADNCHD